MRNQSSKGHEHPSILSQLCMDSDDWQCVQIHNSAEHCMRHLHSTVEAADLRIPVHGCLQAGYKICVVVSNYTDVIVTLLFRVPNFLQNGLGNCGYRQGEAPQPVLCPFTFYMHGWVLMIYAQSFRHHIASQAVISPAIWVPRKRPSMLKNDPLARIWHNDYTNFCNNSTCRTVLGECCRCWEQVQQFPRTSRTSISLFQINLTSEPTFELGR